MKRRLVFNRSFFIEIISGLFILLFVYTATSKLRNVEGFISTLDRSPLIGNKATILAWTLPIIELIIAILLFIPKHRKRGLYLSTALMIVFTAYIFYMVTFTPDLPCSCGGVLKYLTWGQHLVFNIIYMILGIISIWLYRKNTTNNGASTNISTSFS